ncbi:hypothetical protein GCM10029992_50880 [Glycomyces albus]
MPGSDNRRYASVVDLRGTGTACLVWSTGLPGGTGAAMRYVDLMSAGRPHLLTGYENGTGGEVAIEYRPSTHFMLADEQAGRPWPTTLPFPVSCAHRVTRTDHIRETVFTSRTSYHDGYFDPVEREFRGFGRVETIDTEAYELLPEAANTADADLHQPPVLTRTWYHTGAAATTAERLLHTRRSQYYQNPELPEHELPEPELPADITDEEYREACRALKGVMLRTEVYGLDDAEASTVPYSVSEAAYRVRLLQPRGDRRHGVFQLFPTEAIGYAYDRRPADPRVSHSFVLEVDELGRPLRSASVTYRRAVADPAVPAVVRNAQDRTHAGYSEVDYTADLDQSDARRLGTAFESRSFELAGLSDGFLSTAQVDAAVGAAERVPYEAVEDDGTLAAPAGPVMRLIGRSQTLFRSDDLAGPLPLGAQGLLGLVFRTRSMVFTDGLIATGYDGSVTDAELTDAGYEHLDGGWWMSSGTDLYAPDAPDHFYLPIGSADAAGVAVTVERDAHDLATVSVANHLGQQVHFEPDYRVMAAAAMTDAAGNRAEAAFDVLGATVATALVGKPGEPEMDSIADPTAAMDYDLFSWLDRGEPTSVTVRHRERHGPSNPGWRESHTYFDGAGAAVMSKRRAAPGPARHLDPGSSTVVEVHADPRWIGNGRSVFNNKGLPVKQYEPYFSTTHEYESEAELVQVGVTAVPRYDPSAAPSESTTRTGRSRAASSTLGRPPSTARGTPSSTAPGTPSGESRPARARAGRPPRAGRVARRPACRHALHFVSGLLGAQHTVGRRQRRRRPAAEPWRSRRHRPLHTRIRQPRPPRALGRHEPGRCGTARRFRRTRSALDLARRGGAPGPDLGRARPQLPRRIRRTPPADRDLRQRRRRPGDGAESRLLRRRPPRGRRAEPHRQAAHGVRHRRCRHRGTLRQQGQHRARGQPLRRRPHHGPGLVVADRTHRSGGGARVGGTAVGARERAGRGGDVVRRVEPRRGRDPARRHGGRAGLRRGRPDRRAPGPDRRGRTDADLHDRPGIRRAGQAHRRPLWKRCDQQVHL